MHNAGPQLFLCIVTFYARRNVSQSVTICDLCQKCHTLKIIGENQEVLCIYMVSTFMGERLLLKKELREVCLTEFTWLCPSWGILRHLSIPQIPNFGQGSADNSPKMEACCKFGKSWHGKMSKILATIHKKHIRVDFDPKNFRYCTISIDLAWGVTCDQMDEISAMSNAGVTLDTV